MIYSFRQYREVVLILGRYKLLDSVIYICNISAVLLRDDKKNRILERTQAYPGWG